MRRAVLLALLVLAPASPAAGQVEAGGSWRAIAPSPLTPRELATGVWTGQEVVVVGGSDAEPCPPNAGCAPAARPPLADGAAYAPATNRWRRIARAPVRFDFASAATVGDRVYVLAPGDESRTRSPRAFMAYSLRADAWERLPPPRRMRSRTLLAAGDRLLATGGGLRPAVFDPAARTWAPLAGLPFAKRHPLQLVDAPGGLVALACLEDTVPPCQLRAAAQDRATGAWRVLPDPPGHTLLPTWAAVGGLVVNPDTQTIFDGAYAFGGILDPVAGTWSALPPVPADRLGTGVVAGDGASYAGGAGLVLDLARRVWIRVPRVAGVRSGETVVSAGRDLFVFGGARFSRGGGRLISRGRIWSPPSG